MHIAFKFHYIHDNGLFVRVLREIQKRSHLPLRLSQTQKDYVIEASGEQAELETLAELVSALVPQSLFLKSYAIEEIQTPNTLHPLPEHSTPYEVPCCPECQKKIFQTLNPFEPCGVCGFTETVITFESLRAETQSDAKSADELFLALAERLIEKETITLPTFNGIRQISLLKSVDDQMNGILMCDPSNISDFWVITQGELDTLRMIEKPSLRLKPKLKFRAENGLTKPFYPVFFADDKITSALGAALSRKGVKAVYCSHAPILRAAFATGHSVIIAAGRDMLPWHHPLGLNQPSCCTFERFEGSGDTQGLVLQSAVESLSKPCVRFVANGESSPFSHAISFEPVHAALRSVVLEHELQGKSLCGLYLSRRHRSQICSFSTKIGYTPMSYFSDELLNSPREMLSAITQMDEAGARLVANYQKTYPQLIEKIEHARFETNENVSMLIKLWGMAALFIGLCDGDTIQNGCEQLEATALEFNGKSGPRIDYKVIKTPLGYEVDPRLAIRSAMSFKLAGVDDYLLSYGFIDSLADFIAQQAEMADANIAISGVALGGSLFENRQLLTCTYNVLQSNYPIFHNERLSMDGANVAVGAITLGSE